MEFFPPDQRAFADTVKTAIVEHRSTSIAVPGHADATLAIRTVLQELAVPPQTVGVLFVSSVAKELEYVDLVRTLGYKLLILRPHGEDPFRGVAPDFLITDEDADFMYTSAMVTNVAACMQMQTSMTVVRCLQW